MRKKERQIWKRGNIRKDLVVLDLSSKFQYELVLKKYTYRQHTHMNAGMSTHMSCNH